MAIISYIHVLIFVQELPAPAQAELLKSKAAQPAYATPCGFVEMEKRKENGKCWRKVARTRRLD